MARTLIQLVQEFTARTGLPIPNAVAGNVDAQVRQLMGLMNEFCEDMLVRGRWQNTTCEASFTTVAMESQGLLSSIAPRGFRGVVPETMFDRTDKLPVPGGLDAAEWQAQKSLINAAPRFRYRITNGQLKFLPAPPAGHTVVFEYYSDQFIYNAAAGMYRDYWFSDDDTCLFPDALPLSWLRWAWKKEKGLEYAEDFQKYERLLAASSSVDKNSPQRNLAGSCDDPTFGVIIPQGSWSL